MPWTTEILAVRGRPWVYAANGGGCQAVGQATGFERIRVPRCCQGERVMRAKSGTQREHLRASCVAGVVVGAMVWL
jgi:hypothetical protein